MNLKITSLSRRILRNNGISFLIRASFEVQRSQFLDNGFCDICSRDCIEKEERPHLIISGILASLYLSLFLLIRTIGGKKEKNEGRK